MIINVNGKDYIVAKPIGGGVYGDRAAAAIWLDYWSTRDGKKFGPIRGANTATAKPKSVGAQLIAAALEGFGLDPDELIREFRARREADRVKYAHGQLI